QDEFCYQNVHTNTWEPLVSPVPKLTPNSDDSLYWRAKRIAQMSLPASIRQRAQESLDHLASVPISEWGLKENFLREELNLIHSRPPPGQPISETSQIISD